MKPIPITTTVDIEPEAISAALTPEELGGLFCDISEKIAAKSYTLSQRRVLIGQIADGMHENGITMMGEVLALAHQRARSMAAPRLS